MTLPRISNFGQGDIVSRNIFGPHSPEEFDTEGLVLFVDHDGDRLLVLWATRDRYHQETASWVDRPRIHGVKQYGLDHEVRVSNAKTALSLYRSRHIDLRLEAILEAREVLAQEALEARENAQISAYNPHWKGF